MRHQRITWIAILLIAVLLAGCGAAEPTNPQTEPPVSTGEPTEVPTEAPTEVPIEAPTEAPTEPSKEGTVSDYVDEAYAEQIGRYYTALSEQWEEGRYFDSDMSALPYYYYEGEPLDNVDFVGQVSGVTLPADIYYFVHEHILLFLVEYGPAEI